MSLREVLLSDLVYQSCLQHALSTEREEVLGMLLGDVTPDGRAALWGSSAVQRSDKRPDRVEIKPEQLCRIADEAELITQATRCRTRVIGWYHSHPRITPYPSHVDLATQALCQSMEKYWVGLIFSAFHFDPHCHRSRITLHCFATLVDGHGAKHHLKIPVRVVPSVWLHQQFASSAAAAGVDAVIPPPEGAAPFYMMQRLPMLLSGESAEAVAAARTRVVNATMSDAEKQRQKAKPVLDTLFGEASSPSEAGSASVAAASSLSTAVAHFDELASHASAEVQYQMSQLLLAEGLSALQACRQAQQARIEALRELIAQAKERQAPSQRSASA